MKASTVKTATPRTRKINAKSPEALAHSIVAKKVPKRKLNGIIKPRPQNNRNGKKPTLDKKPVTTTPSKTYTTLVSAFIRASLTKNGLRMPTKLFTREFIEKARRNKAYTEAMFEKLQKLTAVDICKRIATALK